MAVLHPQDFADFVKGMFPTIDRGKYENLATTFQRCSFLSEVMALDKLSFEAGEQIKRPVLVSMGDSTDWVGLFSKRPVNVGNVMQEAAVTWTFLSTSWAYDQIETHACQTASAIYNFVEAREKAALLGRAEKLERAAWDQPAAVDSAKMFPIDYWVYRHTNTSGAFNAYNHGLWAAGPGGLDATAYVGWRNWEATYTSVSQDDLLDKMRTALRFCNWELPPGVAMAQNSKGIAPKMRFFMMNSTLLAFQKLARSQNDNNGLDVGNGVGFPTFSGFPLVWTPALETCTAYAYYPIYGLDLDSFYPVVQSGYWDARQGPMVVSGEQPTTWVTHINGGIQMLCDNRRRQMVFSTQTSAYASI
jgi:hypothetical protein